MPNTTAPTHIPSIESILESTLWDRREGVRRAHMAAWVDFLWHRAIWRTDYTSATKRRNYTRAEKAYWETMRLTNHLDGYVWSTLAAKGVDVDALPAGRDACPRCDGDIVEDYGCGCTNIDLARKYA